MFAVLFIPNFSLQAVLRHEPELLSGAVALVDPALPKPAIVQLTAAARAQGVCEGLTASQAMARCAQLIIKPRSLARETVATEVLLQTAYAFSPNIEATAPGVCTMELKGLRIQFDGGEPTCSSAELWARKILELLARFYLTAQIGFAETPELALLAAREAKPILTLEKETNETAALNRRSRREAHSLFSEEDQSLLTSAPTDFKARAIESFPIASLNPPPEIREILHRWGIHTVGAFLALGKDAVTERLGPAAGALFDRVSTASVRPLTLVSPPEAFVEEAEFEKEIETTEPLLFVLRRFVEQLSRRLEWIYLVVAELHLRLGLASGASYERKFKIPSPTGNVETLFRMLQTHLETVRTDSPIMSLRLEAKPCKPEAHQFGLFETTLRDPNQFAETLARLTALVGPENVGSPVLESTHKPDAFRMEAPEFHGAGQASSLSRKRVSAIEDKTSSAGQAGSPPYMALRRFRPAVTAHIEFRQDRPALIRCSVFNGAIADARGPFLSSGNWWDDSRWSREEWDVQTRDGSLLRVFRSDDGCFVEGVYD